MKTYVLTVSRLFPATHKRKGERTYFTEKIACGVFCPGDCSDCNFKTPKIHTIRANYDLWAKRIKEVQEGKAILSLRYWSGKPYHKDKNGIGQIEFCRLDKDSDVGIQEIEFYDNIFLLPGVRNIVNGKSKYKTLNPVTLAKNDGLSLADFEEWFKSYDLSKPVAVIHFTSFRY